MKGIDGRPRGTWRRLPVAGLLLAFAPLLAAGVGAAATPPPLEVRRGGENYPLLEHLEILEAAPATLSLAEAGSGPAAARFRPAAGVETLPPKQTDWFRFTLVSRDPDPTVYLLATGQEVFRVYEDPAAGGALLGVSGDGVPVRLRPSESLTPSVPILLVPGQPRRLYVQAEHHFGLRAGPASFALWSEQPAAARRANWWHGLGFVYGFVAAIVLLNLALYGLARDRLHLLCALFTASVGMTLYNFDGLAGRFLWPETPLWSRPLETVLFEASLAAGLLFVQGFTGGRAAAPRLWRWAWPLLALHAAGGLALFTGWFPVAPPVVLRWGSAGLILGNVLIVALAVACLVLAGRRGQRSAWVFLAGVVLLCGSSLADSLFGLGLLPKAWGGAIRLSWYPSLLVMLGFVTGGVAHDARRLGRETREAQRRELAAQRATVESQQRLLVAFARFVPGDFLRCLGKADITEVRLGDAVEARMTVLFSDLRAFTTLSERLSPAESFAFINRYLGEVGPIIRRHGGFVDKYIGDAVMALFPAGPAGAAAAAVAMVRAAREFRHSFDGGRTDAPVGMAVGLHGGPLMLGTIGEAERMDPTVISDAVNIAARLESLTKELNANILCSEACAAELSGDPGADWADGHRWLGRFHLKGKAEPLSVVEIFAADPEEIRRGKAQTRDEFEAAVRRLEAGDAPGALAAFQAVLEVNPEDSAARHYLARCGDGSVLRAVTAAAPAG